MQPWSPVQIEVDTLPTRDTPRFARSSSPRTTATRGATHAVSPAIIGRTREAIDRIFGPASTRRFAVRLWDGTTEGSACGAPPAFTLVLPTPGALRAMLLPPSELQLGEAFVSGAFDVEGDLETAVAVGRELRQRLIGRSGVRALATLARLPHAAPRPSAARRAPNSRWMRAHSLRRDASAIRAHYDVGNDFYALWLDRRLVYSCAYFEAGSESLDEAQEAKLDLICRKLRLRPGERLLDIGCGWGGLIIYAAVRYGVRALGITLSETQAALARERIAATGLDDRCRVEVADYRALAPERTFDKVVSVGMVEHVGRSQLRAYAQRTLALTAPGGLFLNHGIVAAPEAPGILAAVTRRLWREGTFIDRHVFPDGELPQLSDIVRAGEGAGFETCDVESLREHYALTLRHWVCRLESAAQEAVRLVGARDYRTWRLYMAASANAFASGRLGLAQILFARPTQEGRVGLPRTRADVYREEARERAEAYPADARECWRSRAV